MDAGARAQPGERLHDQREPVGEVVAGAANALSILAGDDAEAVVLDLVQPRLPRWAAAAPSQAGRDEAERHGHTQPIRAYPAYRAWARAASNQGPAATTNTG